MTIDVVVDIYIVLEVNMIIEYGVCRNVRKCAGGDELSSTCRTTEGLKVVNGLECKIACSSSKV